MSTPRKRTTKTKAEIESEFGDVAEKHASKTALPAKEADALAQHQRETLAKVMQLTPDKVIQTIGAVQLDVTQTLSQVSQLLVEKTQELQGVNEAIAIRKEELERLHGVDVVASSLDVLLAEHEERKQALEKEISDARLSWQQEQVAHNQLLRERNETTEKQRAREEIEFKYQLSQKRRGDEDAWNEQVRTRNRAEQDRIEQLNKSWLQREEALAAQEKEVADLRAAVAAHPEQLKKETDKQVAIVTNSLAREHKHTIEMLTHEANSKVQLLSSELAQERKTVTALTTQVAELQAKLADANQKVTEVATKALESASGQSALAAVQKFASESSTNGPSKRS
jgi:DNA repair exonuclease SbcCD ATPase subunit